MNRISCTRLIALGVLAASLGAAACDSQGCGGQEMGSTQESAPQITCGPGTTLQAGQCVVTQSVNTR